MRPVETRAVRPDSVVTRAVASTMAVVASPAAEFAPSVGIRSTRYSAHAATRSGVPAPRVFGCFRSLRRHRRCARRWDPTGHAVVSDGVTRGLLIGVAAGWLAVPLYVRHANGNDALQRYERKRWLFALRLYAPVAMFVYWRRYLR